MSGSFRKTSVFHWTPGRSRAALALAEGKTQAEAAAEAEVTDRSIRLWLEDEAFAAEVDRLTLMIGIAARAERLRIAKRIVRQRVKDDAEIRSDKDLLDWLKFAQSETDGIKLDLAALAQATAQVADSGSD